MQGKVVDIHHLYTQMRWSLADIDRNIKRGVIEVVRRSGKVKFRFLVD